LRTLEERTRLYTEHAIALGTQAAEDALAAASCDRSAVNILAAVSSTGYIVPSLDAHLAGRLGLNPACQRVSLTQLGCAGGVGALSLAAQLLAGNERRRALVVSVELPSLCLQGAEPSVADVIASIQFGDGVAAAVLTTGDQGDGPEIVATRTVLFPDSLDASEVRLTETGLRVVQSRDFIRTVRRHVGDAVDTFLRAQSLHRSDVGFWLIHPRTPQLLETIGKILEVPERALRPSWAVWETCGNIVSASVFFMLRYLQREMPPREGDWWIMLAPGVGVACEMALLRWHE